MSNRTIRKKRHLKDIEEKEKVIRKAIKMKDFDEKSENAMIRAWLICVGGIIHIPFFPLIYEIYHLNFPQVVFWIIEFLPWIVMISQIILSIYYNKKSSILEQEINDIRESCGSLAQSWQKYTVNRYQYNSVLKRDISSTEKRQGRELS